MIPFQTAHWQVYQRYWNYYENERKISKYIGTDLKTSDQLHKYTNTSLSIIFLLTNRS